MRTRFTASTRPTAAAAAARSSTKGPQRRFVPKRAGELDRDAVFADFGEAVNMTAKQIRKHLRTAESKAVGFTYPGQRESVGRQSARRIINILERGPRPDDFAHMRKVIGYVRRHLAQRPRGEVRDTRWAASLKNWGHDPLLD